MSKMKMASKEFLAWVDWYSKENNIHKNRPLLAEDEAFRDGVSYAKYSNVKPSFNPATGPKTTQIDDAFVAGFELVNKESK